jgi:hypothetical protein
VLIPGASLPTATLAAVALAKEAAYCHCPAPGGGLMSKFWNDTILLYMTVCYSMLSKKTLIEKFEKYGTAL